MELGGLKAPKSQKEKSDLHSCYMPQMQEREQLT